MTKISYLNGEFLPHEKCLVHIEDRGFQFADGVYEVTLFKNSKLIDGEPHIDRLFRRRRVSTARRSICTDRQKHGNNECGVFCPQNGIRCAC